MSITIDLYCTCNFEPFLGESHSFGWFVILGLIGTNKGIKGFIKGLINR